MAKSRDSPIANDMEHVRPNSPDAAVRNSGGYGLADNLTIMVCRADWLQHLGAHQVSISSISIIIVLTCSIVYKSDPFILYVFSTETMYGWAPTEVADILDENRPNFDMTRFCCSHWCRHQDCFAKSKKIEAYWWWYPECQMTIVITSLLLSHSSWTWIPESGQVRSLCLVCVQDCFRLTSTILQKDPYALEAVPLYLTSALELRKKNDLFLQAHRSGISLIDAHG